MWLRVCNCVDSCLLSEKLIAIIDDLFRWAGYCAFSHVVDITRTFSWFTS